MLDREWSYHGGRRDREETVSWDRKKGGVKKFRWVSQAGKDLCKGKLDLGKLDLGPYKLAAQLPVSKSSFGPNVTSPTTFEPGDCSVKCVGPIFSSNSNEPAYGKGLYEVGESSLAGAENSAHAPATVVSPKALPQTFGLEPEVPGQCAKPPMEANCPFSDGVSPDEPTMTPGKTNKVISRSSVELFLSDFFLSLSRAGLVDLGVNDGDEGGWDSRASLKQGIDNNGFRPKAVLEHDQSNLAVIPTKAVCVVPEASVLVEEEMDISDIGGEDSLSIPLMTITPFGLALSAELNCGTEAVGCVNTLDISNWVKYKLPGFSKLVGLPLSRHEKLCIALLRQIKRETEAAKVLNRKVTVPREVVIYKDKGKRELGNLKSSVNYDGR